MNILSTAITDDLIDTVLDDGQLTSIEHHADVRVGEVVLLVTRASPWELTHLASFHVTKEQGAVGGGNKESVLVNIDLADLISILRLEHDTLSVLKSLDQNLRQGYISKFKFALVTAFLKANFEDINGAAKGAN